MSLERDFAGYYAARAPIHDEKAGCLETEGERLREPIKPRFRALFARPGNLRYSVRVTSAATPLPPRSTLPSIRPG